MNPPENVAADPAAGSSLDRQILQELIYERVRVSINLCQLVIFEQDLDKSVRRALESCGEQGEARRALVRRYIDDAWHRIEHEWARLRDDSALWESGWQEHE